MRRSGDRRTPIAMAVASAALAVVGIVFVASRWSDDGPVEAGSTVVRVVPGTAVPVADPGGSSTQVQGGTETPSGSASGDVAALEGTIAAGLRDQRTARDEARLADIIKTTLPGLRNPTVTCAGLTCRVSGGLPTVAGSAREYFRSVDFSDAIFSLGYSPAPNQFKARNTGADITLYLKREN